MKKILYIFGILTLAACNDFLDEAPRGSAIAQDVSEYNGLFNNFTLVNMVDIDVDDYSFWKSDEFIFEKDSAYSDINKSFAQGRYPESIKAAFQYREKVYRDDEQCQIWEMCYNQIYTYNVIANGVPEATGLEAQKKYLEAEARVSCAYMHFLLAQWFAMPYNPSTAAAELAVPIVKEANTRREEYTRATVAELYDFVVSEMETYCPLLEERPVHNKRVYKATGYALLGKVYWTMGQYDKAIAPLTKSLQLLEGDPNVSLYDYNITQTGLGLSDFIDMMLETPGASAYFGLGGITELPGSLIAAMGPKVSVDNQEALFVKHNNLVNVYFLGVTDQKTTPGLKPEVYAKFDANDLRRNYITTMHVDVEALFGSLLAFSPYTPEPQTYPFAVKGTLINYGVELPEVYLMLAEAEARAGSETTARTLLETLRQYRMKTGFAAVPAGVVSKDDLIRFCVDEQTREFVGSNHRWGNIRRLWTDPLFQSMKPITHTDGENTYTLQEAQLKLEIPKTVLDWNANWK